MTRRFLDDTQLGVTSKKFLNIISYKPIKSFRTTRKIVEECGDKHNLLKIQFTTPVKLVTQTVRFNPGTILLL
jgi:hypothetical protein